MSSHIFSHQRYMCKYLCFIENKIKYRIFSIMDKPLCIKTLLGLRGRTLHFQHENQMPRLLDHCNSGVNIKISKIYVQLNKFLRCSHIFPYYKSLY